MKKQQRALLDYHDELMRGEREPDEGEFEQLVFQLCKAALERGQEDSHATVPK